LTSKSKGGNTAAAVRAIAEPIAVSLGLRLWDICFLKEGASWYLRIFIDKDGGVGIEDCEAFSRAIDGPLDEQDIIEQSYCLEVSSPGIERELTKPEHFTACIGKKIKLRMIRPTDDGKRDFSGVLLSYDGGTVSVRLGDGTEMSFAKKEAAFVKLDDFDE